MVKPSILECMFMSSVMLLICKLSLVLYSAGSGVKSVLVILYELSMRLFDLVQTWCKEYVWCVCVKECERLPLCEMPIFQLVVCRCRVSQSCLSFASIDVICNELSDGIKYVGVNEFFLISWCIFTVVKCLAYVKYYSECM